MEILDLPKLPVHTVVDVKIYDENPIDTPMIMPEYLGKTIRMVFYGYSYDKIENAYAFLMVNGKPIDPTSNAFYSFHSWLIESITVVEA